MRRSLLAAVLFLCLAGSAQAAYDHGSGGAVTPASITVGGGTDYSVSLTGKPAVVDIVLVLDNSGSMSNIYASGNSKWQALSEASKTFVSELSSSGFFARGGKVGVVLFATAASTGTAPTSNLTAINEAIANAAPSGNSCISCGLQRAAELFSGVAGSSSHKRIAYVFADGANNVTPPTVSEAIEVANAAGVQRRVIGIGAEAAGNGLEALDSDGAVPYPTTIPALASAYNAEPTKLPGATGVSWAFHLAPGFAASAPAASIGSVAIAGSDVTWTIPSLGEETATLSFHAAHAASSGCAAGALLTGTSFADAEGDAAPAVSLGPLSLTGCKRVNGPVALSPSSVISLPKSSSKCSTRHSITLKLKPPKGTSLKRVKVKVGSHKAKTYSGKQAKKTIQLTGLPKGSFKVKVTITLDDGRTTTLTRSYKSCPPPRR